MLSSRIWNAGHQLSMSQLTNAFRAACLQVNNLSTKSSPLPISSAVEKSITQSNQSVIEKVNNQVARQSEGRLFAVVHVCGKQFKITSGDIIIVEGYWPPNIGDKIRLDKKRRKQFVRFNFQRAQNTMVMINSINIVGRVNETKQTENPIRIF